MKISVAVDIKASKKKVWKVITDFDNWVNVIHSCEKVEVLEKGKYSLVGLKWKETRVMFGKSATETMTITEAVKNEYYLTHAQSHGAIYTSRIQITPLSDSVSLRMTFNAQPQTILAKLMYLTMGFLFKGATKKALLKDLEDIKNYIEKD